MTEYIGTDAMRQKVMRSIDKYLKISKNQSLTVGFYFNGKRYVFSNSEKPEELMYDIGSISKTVTAHRSARGAIFADVLASVSCRYGWA